MRSKPRVDIAASKCPHYSMIHIDAIQIVMYRTYETATQTFRSNGGVSLGDQWFGWPRAILFAGHAACIEIGTLFLVLTGNDGQALIVANSALEARAIEARARIDLITRLIADELHQLRAKPKNDQRAPGAARVWIVQAQTSRRETFDLMRQYRRMLLERQAQQTVLGFLAAE